jgi:single-strand DNA-binding protein
MNESFVRVQGWVGTDVDLRDAGETQVASFRLGSTPRYNRGGAWVDGHTSWYTVNCWRTLARNVKESVRRGDAVVIHGRVRVDVWEREGLPSTVQWVVDATFVGHDLTKGTSRFQKAAQVGQDPREDDAVRELAAPGPDGPRPDASGGPAVPAA